MNQAQLESALDVWAGRIIDIWFADKPLLAPTFKTIVRANMYHLRDLTKMLTDADGNVYLDELLTRYEQAIPADGLKLNARELFGDNIITRNISIKVLERSDIAQLRQLIENQ